MGKTKDITVHNNGTCTFTFKDDACGEDGVFDPGANQVGLKIDGMGKASLMLSRHFFDGRLAGVPTHYISSDIEKGTMTCKQLNMLPIEFIWRAYAWGSFCKMYGAQKGKVLTDADGNGLVESTVKSDDLGDPRINKEAAVKLGKITAEQYDTCVRYIHRVGIILQSALLEHDLRLIDFKLEFGIDAEGQVRLGDEISGGIWRITDLQGNIIDPLAAARKICKY